MDTHKQSAPTRGLNRLDGKVAIITGAGGGIGAAAALAFSREGARVLLVDRRQEGVDEIAHKVVRHGGKAIAVAADVSIADNVEGFVEDAVRHFGRLDCAFNNAGIMGSFGPVVDLSEEDFDHVIAVNLKGVWLSMKYELKTMLKTGPGKAIVNTSSFLASAATSGTAAYSASKVALDGMIRAVALEVGPSGIRVNNVRPGVTDTPMLRSSLDDEMMQPFAEFAALKRIGKAEDVADVAMWLCTDEARFVTAQSILVDGGFAIPGMR